MIHRNSAGQENVLAEIAVVVPRLKMWGATRKASREHDLKGVKLPPRNILSNGEIRLVSPKVMEWCGKFRKRHERILKQYGTSTYAGHLVPVADLPELAKELDEFSVQFAEEVSAFINELPVYAAEWQRINPEWQRIIGRREVDPANIRQRFGYRYTVFTPQGVAGHEDSVEDLVESIPESVATEIAAIGKGVWERSIKGRDKCSQRTLGQFRAMHKKLSSFAMLAPVLYPAVDLLESVFDALPPTGEIAGPAFQGLERASLILSDAERILQLGAEQAEQEEHTESTPDPVTAPTALPTKAQAKVHQRPLVDNSQAKTKDDNDADSSQDEETASASPVWTGGVVGF